MKFENASKLIFNTDSCVNVRGMYLLFGYIFVSLFIFFIPAILKCKSNEFCKKYIDGMCNHVINIRCDLDWWSVTHFIFYIILGFMFPHLWYILIILGISWELIEFGVSKIEKTYFTSNYWRGRWSDLVVNTFGFIVGLSLRYIYTMCCQ